MKFGRNYELYLELDPVTKDTVIIRPPLTLQFNIVRNTLASMNTAHFSVFNLTEQTRRKIFHDRYDTQTYRRVVLKAGYGSDLAIVFRGQMRMANSVRRGVDWITNIECFDGADAVLNGFSSQTFPAETPKKDMIRTLLKDMPNLVGFTVGELNDKTSRGVPVAGNTWAQINSMLSDDEHAFIDNEKAVVKKHNECLAGDIAVINSDTGLLETPCRQDARLDVKVIFEPRAAVGQIIQLESLETVYNGQYEILGFTHAGQISEALCGEASTTLNLWLGTQTLRLLQ